MKRFVIITFISLFLLLLAHPEHVSAQGAPYCTGAAYYCDNVRIAYVLRSGNVLRGETLLVTVPALPSGVSGEIRLATWCRTCSPVRYLLSAPLAAGSQVNVVSDPGGDVLQEWQIVVVDVRRQEGAWGDWANRMFVGLSIRNILSGIISNSLVMWMISIILGGLFGYRWVRALVQTVTEVSHARIDTDSDRAHRDTDEHGEHADNKIR